MVKHGPLVFEYNKITKYVFLGTNLCCQGHFKRTLLKKGIKADISLEEEKIDSPFGVKYFLWLPTKDHNAPSLSQLIIGAEFIQHLTNKKIKVYVHCRRGHGRAPTLIAAYLMKKNNWNEKKAIEFIRKKRKTIHPNKKQLNTLKKFEKIIKYQN
jgi:protein-tyrosine phosphatase